MHPLTKKRTTVVVVLFAVMSCTLVLFIHGRTRVTLRAFSTVSNLGEIREAFDTFRCEHRRWPISMDEIYSEKYFSEGTLTSEHCRDQFAKEPFQCVTGENAFIQMSNRCTLTSHSNGRFAGGRFDLRFSANRKPKIKPDTRLAFLSAGRYT